MNKVAGGGGEPRRGKDPGFHKSVFALRVETVNATGKGPVLARPTETDAEVVFAQETKVTREEVPDISAQLLKAGWKSMWAPALETEAGGKSAGAMICARRRLTWEKRSRKEFRRTSGP